MPYEFHITRRKFWDDHGPAITAEEWLDYVRNDPELKIDAEHGPHCVEWNGPSKLSEPWLDWLDGEIFTEDPDRALLEKMLAIAQKLNAKVQGDEGEVYIDSSELEEPDETKPGSKKTFWSKLFGG